MNPMDYEIDIKRLPEIAGGGYIAIAPELPGCMSDGETPAEALASAYDAVACWISAAMRMGREVPEPARAQEYA